MRDHVYGVSLSVLRAETMRRLFCPLLHVGLALGITCSLVVFCHLIDRGDVKLKTRGDQSPQSRWFFHRHSEDSGAQRSGDYVPRCRGLGGQKKELLGWEIPHADWFPCSL